MITCDLINRSMSLPKKIIVAAAVVAIACAAIALLSQAALPPMIVASSVAALSSIIFIATCIKTYSRQKKADPEIGRDKLQETPLLANQVRVDLETDTDAEAASPPRNARTLLEGLEAELQAACLRRETETFLTPVHVDLEMHAEERAASPPRDDRTLPEELEAEPQAARQHLPFNEALFRETSDSCRDFLTMLCHSYYDYANEQSTRDMEVLMNALCTSALNTLLSSEIHERESSASDFIKRFMVTATLLFEGVSLLTQSPFLEDLSNYLAEIYCIQSLIKKPQLLNQDLPFHSAVLRCEYAINQGRATPVKLHALREGDAFLEGEDAAARDEDQESIAHLRRTYPGIIQICLKESFGNPVEENPDIQAIRYLKEKTCVHKNVSSFGWDALSSTAIEQTFRTTIKASLSLFHSRAQKAISEMIPSDEMDLQKAARIALNTFPNIALNLVTGSSKMRKKTQALQKEVIESFRTEIISREAPFTEEDALIELKTLFTRLANYYRPEERRGWFS